MLPLLGLWRTPPAVDLGLERSSPVLFSSPRCLRLCPVWEANQNMELCAAKDHAELRQPPETEKRMIGQAVVESQSTGRGSRNTPYRERGEKLTIARPGEGASTTCCILSISFVYCCISPRIRRPLLTLSSSSGCGSTYSRGLPLATGLRFCGLWVWNEHGKG